MAENAAWRTTQVRGQYRLADVDRKHSLTFPDRDLVRFCDRYCWAFLYPPPLSALPSRSSFPLTTHDSLALPHVRTSAYPSTNILWNGCSRRRKLRCWLLLRVLPLLLVLLLLVGMLLRVLPLLG